jgi:NHLM bacteriocin system ABC transporter peptidase/ATP-binding protein
MSSSPAALDAQPALRRRSLRTPTVLQMEAVECGAAALAIVLAHFGRWVPLEELRVACGVSRDGARASNIVRAAKSYGLEAKGLRVELDGLDEIELPALVFWRFNHFVVLEGYDRRRVHLNDPAVGPRTVDWEEFDEGFTGVVIPMKPTGSFARGGARPSTLAGLRARAAGLHGAIFFALLAGIGLLVPGLLVPAGVRIFVNEVVVSGNRDWLAPLAFSLVLAALAQLALMWLQQITLVRLAMKLALSMSTRFTEHILRLPLSFFDQRYASQVVTRIQLNDEIATALSGQLATSVLALVTSSVYLALMTIYNWQLALVAVAFACASGLALRAVERRQRDVSRRLVQSSGMLTATTTTAIQNIELLKASSDESAYFARWAGYQAKVVDAVQALGVSSAALSTLPLLLAGLNGAVVLGFGGWQVMHGDMSLGTLVAFQMLATSFAAPIALLVGFGETVQKLGASLASVDDVLSHPTVARPATRQLPEHASGRLELVDVTFGYTPLGPPLLEGLSLHVEAGQRIALVGATGSGKSTVARLAAGLLDPLKGAVLLDGVPREELAPEVASSLVALVEQEFRLFRATVRENLTLWDETIDDAAVVRAAQDACIHDDIVRRPGGYDRLLDDDARDWSSGQRQRLELARALAGDPLLLILDEATSGLDPLVERTIDQNLRARGCGCLIVAHRLSTIRDCDEIIVLDAGGVVERGTHDDLVAKGGAYAGLVTE